MHGYRVFGLTIAADQRIPALDGVEASPGDGRAPAPADIPILSIDTGNDWPDGGAGFAPWHESPEDDTGQTLRVLRNLAGAYRFLYGDGAEFLIEAGARRVSMRWPGELTLDDAVEYLLGPVLGFVLRMRGVVCLHASAVRSGDGCFAVLVPGGHGKSTTAAACARLGLPVLTDDILALSFERDSVSVLPAYPRIRLWPPAVEGLFGDAEALPRISPGNATWDKRYMDLTRPGLTFQSEPLPLRAIYTHEREETDPPGFEELPAAEALVTLLANVYSRCRPEPEARAREFDLLERLAQGVPVKRFRGRYGLQHLDAQCELLRDDCLRTAVPVA